MASFDLNASKNGLISGHTTWVCKSSESNLVDVLFTKQADNSTDLDQDDSGTPDKCAPLHLEQAEEGSPCVITLQCAPHPPAVITSLLVVSEARTIEVYSLAGDYCGTSRGEEDPSWHRESAVERRPFYKSHLILECPATSCEVKLLSLGGRTSVGVARIGVGLRLPEATLCPPNAGASIDLQRVQSIMEEMGTTLSPGAQSLMDMVQFQQKNKADVLGGFLPLLLGGGSLARAAWPSASAATPAEGGESGPGETLPRPVPPAADRGTLADAVSAFLGGRPGRGRGAGPELLPVLHGVCGQVARLRLDAAASEGNRNGPRAEHACCGALEKVLERRMEEMERRLQEHIDQRLDAIQQRLELALQQALPREPDATRGGKSPTPDPTNT